MMRSKKTAKYKIRNNFKILALFNFFKAFRFHAIIMPIYFSKISGSYTLGMSIISMIFISSSIFEIPTGLISDKLGRKKTAIAGTFFYMIAMILYMLGFNYITLLFGALFEGVGRSFYSGNNDALLYETASFLRQKKKYHIILAKNKLSERTAMIIISMIGGIMAAISFRLVFAASLAPLIICLFLSLKFIEPPKKMEVQEKFMKNIKNCFKEFRKNKKLRNLTIVQNIQYGFGMAASEFKYVFMNALVPIWLVGIARGLYNITVVFGYSLVGRVIDKIGHLKTWLYGTLFFEFINLFVYILNNVLSPFILVISGTTQSSTVIARDSLMHHEFSEHERATMGSFVSFFSNIVFGIASLLIGYTADKTSIVVALVFATLIRLATIPLYMNAVKE